MDDGKQFNKWLDRVDAIQELRNAFELMREEKTKLTARISNLEAAIRWIGVYNQNRDVNIDIKCKEALEQREEG